MVFISVKQGDKAAVTQPARWLADLGFKLCATQGTAQHLAKAGIPVTPVNKVNEGRPHIVDLMKNGDVALVFNTTQGKQALSDSFSIRRTALTSHIPYFTTAAGMRAAVGAMASFNDGGFYCKALQDYHKDLL